MSGRGHYGGGSSWAAWIAGGVVIGGAVLWAKHQSDQIAKLYAVTGLPHQSFGADLRARTKEIASSARQKIHRLTAPKAEGT